MPSHAFSWIRSSGGGYLVVVVVASSKQLGVKIAARHPKVFRVKIDPIFFPSSEKSYLHW